MTKHNIERRFYTTESDTLTLAEDNIGLSYDIDPPDTQTARDYMVLMERGDISQSSFSFRVIDVEWGLTADDFPKRTLREVALYDVGPVTFPAYLDADAGVAGKRALADLAERRSLKLEEVIEAAQHNELRDIIRDGVRKEQPEPGQTPTSQLSLARRRLALNEITGQRWVS
jgi:HK97 family phage prohead protease